jgi:ABC-type antimicrobial peptide transport system permease subunit
MLCTIFSGLALGLAAHGLYSVVTYLAVQRFREMGLRMVSGAQANHVLKRVLWKGLQLGALGVALGLVGSVALTRFLESLLHGVSPRDPVTLVAVAALFLLVAVAASLLPALRATRVDPLAMIRS